MDAGYRNSFKIGLQLDGVRHPDSTALRMVPCTFTPGKLGRVVPCRCPQMSVSMGDPQVTMGFNIKMAL